MFCGQGCVTYHPSGVVGGLTGVGSVAVMRRQW